MPFAALVMALDVPTNAVEEFWQNITEKEKNALQWCRKSFKSNQLVTVDCINHTIMALW